MPFKIIDAYNSANVTEKIKFNTLLTFIKIYKKQSPAVGGT